MPKLYEFRDLEMASDMIPHAASLHVQRSPSKDSGYEGLVEDNCVENKMEGSALKARPKKAPRAPALPARSERRASTMLKDVMLELQSLDGSRVKDIEEVSVTEEKDPHELYLSSEEDASLSDFEDSDSLMDFEPMEEAEIMEAELKLPASRGSDRKSQEVTARAVSFTMVKPMIIDITPCTNASPPRPSTSAFESSTRSRPTSLFTRPPTQTRSVSPPLKPTEARRPSPLKLHTSSIRRMSISSFSSLTQSSTTSSTNLAPPTTKPIDKRKSMRMANLAQLVTQSLHKSSSHSFLSTDPYPTPETSPAFPPQNMSRPETPSTPTGTAAAAIKKGFRGLHAARKPSLPKLNSFSSNRNSSMFNLTPPPPISPIPEQSYRQRRKSLAFPTQASVPELSIPDMPYSPLPYTPRTPYSMPLTPQTPLTYQSILKGATQSPPTLKNESSHRKSKSILYMGRRKSLKA